MPDVAVGGCVADVLARATATLAASGCDTPRLDAELLLAHALGRDRAALVLRAGEDVPFAVLVRFESLLARRAAREPVAYVLGAKEFRRISLRVDRRVMIPRPETELLVEVGLTLPPGARVVDVGTGSGAVALSLKDESPELEVSGTDVSASALEVARWNAARLGLSVRFAHADLLDGAGYDAVLANLPYVASDFALAPEIALYEPPAALFAGADGLGVIRRLISAARNRVTLLALEVGAGQADPVSELLIAAGWRDLERRRDLAGHERVVVARR